MALRTYKYAEIIFEKTFSTNRWTNSVMYLRRSITLAAQLGNNEEHQRICSKCLDYADKTDSKEGCYAIIALLRILLEQKYNDSKIGTIIDSVISNNTEIDKLTKAYELKIQYFKKDKEMLPVVKKDFANRLIDDTNKNEKSNVRDLLLAEKNLIKAIQLLQSIGEKELANKIKHQLIVIQSEIPKNMATVTITQDATEKMNMINEAFIGLSIQESVILCTVTSVVL